MRISWARAARDDLRALHRYIAQDSPYHARQFTNRIIAHTEQLADFPRIGREVPEAHDAPEEIRELLLTDYRLIYLVDSNRVRMLAVIHGAKDLAGAETKPWE